MRSSFLLCCLLLSCIVNAQEVYMTELLKVTKYSLNVSVKNIFKYADGTICGEWNTKNSYGLHTKFLSFVFKDNLIIEEGIIGNPYCSNNINKKLAHSSWAKLNEVIENQLDTLHKLKLAESSYSSNSKFCLDFKFKSVCESAEKDNAETISLQANLIDINNRISAAKLELEALR